MLSKLRLKSCHHLQIPKRTSCFRSKVLFFTLNSRPVLEISTHLLASGSVESARRVQIIDHLLIWQVQFSFLGNYLRFSIDNTPLFSIYARLSLKAGFHQQWSRSGSHSQSHNSGYDLLKIENQGHKQSHRLNGIGVRRIRMKNQNEIRTKN